MKGLVCLTSTNTLSALTVVDISMHSTSFNPNASGS